MVLPAPLGPIDADDAAGRQAEVHPLEQEAVAVALGRGPGPRRRGSQVRPGRDLEHDGLVAAFGVLAGELLVALEPGPVLGHAGAGRHPDPLELAGELLAAAAFLLLLECQPGLLLLEPRRVVALPGNALAAVELEDPLGDVVEEVAVVGDEDDGAGVFLQVPFEPGDALGVEVVGRLVEEQEVGAFEQDLAEGDAPAFAAGERADLGVAGGQPHGVHGDLDAAVEVPALGGLDRVLDLGLLFEQGVHLVGVGPLAEPGVDLVEPRRGGRGSARRRSRRCRARRGSGRASAPGARSRSRSRGAGRAVPMKSVSIPAMIRKSVLLPEPLPPITPILAPG